MRVTDLGARRMPEPPPGKADPATGRNASLDVLEAEIRLMREEFIRLRELVTEREEKGRTLINAYREVIAELTNLFEAERKENIKREESLRFFLSSIERRLREDIRTELRGGGGDSGEGAAPRKRRFFGR